MTMIKTRFVVALALVASAAALAPRPALARNEHCAGGIQYVVGALRDRDKGDTEGYQRQMAKALAQLEACSTEDPADFEAIAYLGWAYAEVDSGALAGKWFTYAIEGLEKKGDKKKVEQWTGNRNSYWVRALNDGIAKMKAAQDAYPEFCKKPENEADETLKGEAAKSYDAAEFSLMKAAALRPNEPTTMRNLGSLYAFRCEFQKAEQVFGEALKAAPADTILQQSLRSVRVNYANQLVDQEKYDEAEKFYQELATAEPNSADNFVSLGDLYFKKGQKVEGDARKAQFKLAGDNYSKGAQLRGGDGDLSFNAALAYQNSGEFAKAVEQWNATLKARPDDVDALSSLGASLVELKRCDEAVVAVQRAVRAKPEQKSLHRQLGAIHSKCGNNARATESLMLYLAMDRGTPADAAAAKAAAPAGSTAAKTLAAEGDPDKVYTWTQESQNYVTCVYLSKQAAYTFAAGQLVSKANWGPTAPTK